MNIKIKTFNKSVTTLQNLNFTHWKFPAGEIGVKIQDIDSVWTGTVLFSIEWVINDKSNLSDELMIVCQLSSILKTEFPEAEVEVYTPYLPYSRQDRACSKGEDFALKTFVSMLKSSGVDLLLTDDQHSNIDFDGFIYSSKQSQFVCKIKEDFDWFVAPDKGAFEKTKWNAIRVAEKEFLEASNGSRSMLRLPTAFAMQKVRTPTGITYDDDTSRSDVLYGDVLITDDICDGGATFLQCAEAIRKKHPRVKTISLYVTHGIFSKGVDKLKEVFYSIYTANLMTSDEETNKFVKVI